MPTFLVNVSKIQQNLDAIFTRAQERKIDFVSVVKSFHDSSELMHLFDRRRPSYLGMLKLPLAEKFRDQVQSPIMMTSIPRPADAARRSGSRRSASTATWRPSPRSTVRRPTPARSTVSS